jgi:biotin carboxyl carrier protein
MRCRSATGVAVQRIPAAAARRRTIVDWDKTLERVRSAAEFCAVGGPDALSHRGGRPRDRSAPPRAPLPSMPAAPAAAPRHTNGAAVIGNGRNGRSRTRRRRFPARPSSSASCAWRGPAVVAGSVVGEDRELAYVESLGIRNPVRSGGPGRVADVFVNDGEAVEYGQPLFSIEDVMFKKLLIANRGEIAMRVNRAAHELGIETVAIFSEADRASLHVRNADQAFCVGPGPVARSYLNIPNIISAALISGADAIHPGYGFLAENARFAEICADHGLTFVGPSPRRSSQMGDKATAKRSCGAAGVPTTPGSDILPSVGRRADGGERARLPRHAQSDRRRRRQGMRAVRGPEELEHASRPRKPKPRRISKTAGSTWKS